MVEENKDVIIKGVKFTKGSKRSYLHIPAFLIKNGDLDPDKIYDVVFKESSKIKK